MALVGLAAAVAVRVEVAGTTGAPSIPAGVVFAVIVAASAAATRDPSHLWHRSTRKQAHFWSVDTKSGVVVAGVVGAVVLCVPAALRHFAGDATIVSGHGYALWAVGVVAVASAEEALLRGSLYRAVEQRAGAVAAVALTSVAFAIVHIPLYGWAVVPLDLAVGVWLGVLRAVSGSVLAPAIAHSLADLAGWWLR